MARRDRDFFSSESQYRDETETFFFRVSMSRRDRDFFSSESQCRDETETFFSESQYRDETEFKVFFELTKAVEQVLKVFFAKNLRTKNLGS